VSPSSVSLLPGTDFTLTANASGGTSPYTYQWYNATSGTGIPIAGANSSTYTATAGSAAGTFDYYVTVTDSESPPQTAQSPNSVVTVSLPPSGITYYVPITLTNSQSSNTPAPFQQMVNISESAYPNYLTYNGNSANFEFFTSSGTVLPAWIESSNSGKLITWVKLPNGIPADSNTIIYLGFASNTVNLLSSSGTTGIGEAPQLPCGSTATSSCSTYGEYDDGANVFIHYGGGGPTGWSQFTFVGGTWSTANKYLQQTSTSGTYVGGPAALVESASYPATGNYILGMAFNYTIEADARVGIIAVATPTTAPDTFGYRFVGQQTSFGAGFLSFLNDFVGWVTNNVYQGAVSTPYTMTITDADGTWSGNLYSGYGEGSTILTSLAAVTYSANNYKGTNSGYVGISATYASSTTPGSDVANPLDVMWFYMRAYPPNGAMPTAAFGNGVTV
ncbi:hypothetical protein M1614_00395, partial [Candidatus Marsarchaeota archaeon]|nr:hypothetical protein [Candidatus Marsarchaeota archaeon]